MRKPKKPIDQIIDEAFAEGKFDDLEGKGKPLVLDTSPDAVIRNLLKNANVVPDWITLSSEIERRIQEADRMLDAYAAEYAQARAALEAKRAGGSATAGDVTTDARPVAPPRGLAAVVARVASLASRLSLGAPPPTTESDCREALAAFHRRWDATLTQYAAHLHLTNRKIRRFNQVVPLANRQLRVLPVAERLTAFVERFPRWERSPDGALLPAPGSVPDSLLQPPPDDEETRLGRNLSQAAALHSKRGLGRRPPPIG